MPSFSVTVVMLSVSALTAECKRLLLVEGKGTQLAAAVCLVCEKRREWLGGNKVPTHDDAICNKVKNLVSFGFRVKLKSHGGGANYCKFYVLFWFTHFSSSAVFQTNQKQIKEVQVFCFEGKKYFMDTIFFSCTY